MTRPEYANLAAHLVALAVAIVACEIALSVRRQQATAKPRPDVDGGCHDRQEHDWLNWSAASPLTRKVPAGLMAHELVEQEVFVQTRTCTRCNLQQRAMS